MTIMKPYNHSEIEPKWQKIWEDSKIYEAKDDTNKKKFFGLIEFPYPSGDGLHVGHIRSNTAMDIISRKRRMQGYEVLYPIGWDAFGLPTENYAIKTGIQPAVVTKNNTETFRRQLKQLGFSFDWSREVDTTDPGYYRWTQWIFLQLLKQGLAYKKKLAINWCPKDLIGLANEEVVDGKCERCGTVVEKKDKEQWMLAITKYAERLDKDLDDVNFLEKIKIQQRNWIGKSEGVNLSLKVKGTDLMLEMYDSIPQTFAAQTFTIIAPEHHLIDALITGTSQEKEVREFIAKIKSKKIQGGFDHLNDMEGIFTGRYVEYPPTGRLLPLWVASYAVADYGTGIVNCSAHDERDFTFAKKYNIELHPVLFPRDSELAIKVKNTEVFYREADGIMAEPEEFKGRRWDEVRKDVINYLVEKGWATKKTNYKLRDWVFSRQRYWGEPIPVVHCSTCGTVPIPESALPVLLPEVENYQPTQTGESPLATITDWVNTTCPKCGGAAKRETDTMPNWAGSSWYYLRYVDPKNKEVFADAAKLKYWTPVDWYNGGMEHTTLHLLYSRFWHKFLFDQGLVPTSEPYMKRTSHGMINAEGGEKMSKSKGNVINPDGIVKSVGADALRLYEMFMGPFDQHITWDTNGIVGTRRFIEKVWKLQEKISDLKPRESAVNVSSDEMLKINRTIHKTIKKVSDDIESMSFNTAISTMMITVNELEKVSSITKDQYSIILKLLSPLAPHVTEELWEIMGNTDSVHTSSWPEFDANLLIESEVTISLQVNGKARGTFKIATGTPKDQIEKVALDLPETKRWTEGKKIVKTIVVPGRLVSFVTE